MIILGKDVERPTLVDCFAGGGGVSTGTVNGLDRHFGLKPGDYDLVAINHDHDAITTHSMNHPWARHIHDDMEVVDPRDVLDPDEELLMLIGAPPCQHHSQARGGKPRDDQQRASPNMMLKWIEVGRPIVGLMENVPDIETWGPLDENGKMIPDEKGTHFRKFLADIRDLGYDVGYTKLNAADHGDPQSRKRLFIQFRRDGHSLLWPEPLYAKGGKGGLAPWRGAIEILDLTQPTKSIFGRKRPLSVKTRARIARGIRSRGSFWELLAYSVENDIGPVPLIDMMQATPYEQWPENIRFSFTLGQQGGAEVRDINDPLHTIPAGGALRYGEIAFHLPEDGPGGNGTNNPPRSLSEPLSTIRASRGGGRIVDTPFIVQSGGPERSGERPRGGDEPLPTLLPRTHLNVVDTPFLVPAHGERPGQEPRFHDCAEPFPTLPAVRQPDLVLMQLIANYNGNMGMRDAADALSTVTTHERHALFEVKLNDVMVDVRMRMLTIKELARGQSFPDSYQWHGSPRSVRRQIGNAIPVVTSERLVSTILQPILRGN